MRTRVTLFDDARIDATLHPSVVQSLDVPMVGQTDPGPEQADGDIRIPGTNIRLRVSFLADESAEAIALPSRGYLNDMARGIHAWALGKGFWKASTTIAEKIALMHSELSEALEEVRKLDPDDLNAIHFDASKPNEAGAPEPYGFAVEMADAIIRVLDTAAFVGVDMDRAIAEKRAYNQNRPFQHGKRF